MPRRRDRAGSALSPEETPRDVEAVEAVVVALDRGVAGDLEAHRIITSTLVSELEFGAVWLPAGNGSFELAGEWGTLAPLMSTAGADRLTLGAGAGGDRRHRLISGQGGRSGPSGRATASQGRTQPDHRAPTAASGHRVRGRQLPFSGARCFRERLAG